MLSNPESPSSSSWAASLLRGAAKTLREDFSAVREELRGAAETVREEYQLTFNDYGCRFHHVRQSLLAIDFPSPVRQHWLAKRLNRDHAGSYLIVNLSGQTYDTAELQGPVMDIMLSGCVLPIDVLLRLCISAHKWLSQSPQNVLAAHGMDDRIPNGSSQCNLGRVFGPVIILFACYLSWVGHVANPTEGMLDVCAALDIPESVLWPSQRRYLGYFEVLQHGCIQTIGAPCCMLARIVLVVQRATDGAQRELEVWHQESLLFQAILDEETSDVEAPELLIPLHVGVECQGDLALRLMRIPSSDDPSFPIARPEAQVCFHTAFVTAAGGVARFSLHDIDAPQADAGALLSATVDYTSVDVFLEPLAEPITEKAAEGPRETAANAAAEEAAVLGPADGPPVFNLAADDDDDLKAPVFCGNTGSRGRTVFAPEDVDAIFGDL